VEQPHIIIQINDQQDGYVFRLRPRSRLWLEQEYPEKYRVASVFIGFDKAEDVRQVQEPVWQQVANLLTGLLPDELNQLGGFAIINPSTGATVYHSLLVHV
jgi:hypothetical protein